MKMAIISDVHANFAALEAVLADIRRRAPDEIICLGDTVGYGPQPVECLSLVRQVCSVVLMGNHEHAILYGSEQFTPLAQTAIDWTARVLHNSGNLDYISSLVSDWRRDSLRFVHGSIRNPLLDYVREADTPWAFFYLVRTLQNEFKDFNICFVGHNHRAFLGTEIGYIFPHETGPVPQTKFHIGNEKVYVSVGSVGQPRDGDWRSSWVMFDGEEVEYHRVEYDRDKTIRLINQAGLPEFLAERLQYGN
ncbi:MAG: metallophosphatase family protein [Planctomycetota bacterium]|jgi:diadenosine tetraphosphatase ApaH/serine/threonine PP2A family protein phosphatase|nr:metallophosphatase family protein [Planctomycetota bacterium]